MAMVLRHSGYDRFGNPTGNVWGSGQCGSQFANRAQTVAHEIVKHKKVLTEGGYYLYPVIMRGKRHLVSIPED